MRKHFRFVCRSAAFLVILCVCIIAVYQVITPKMCYGEMLSTTLSHVSFYEMEKDTVDVIFLGSSMAATAFIPQELYDLYGIRSYNLSSAKQSPVVSYYWLKEALRYQSPKVVVMDCNYFFKTNNLILNSTESYIRGALDYMKWSPVKLEAICTICELDESQSWSSYFFPNIRYHERWTELGEKDFTLTEIVGGYDMKGYAPLAGQLGGGGYVSYEKGDVGEETGMPPLMEEYLDKIYALCKEEGISLVLTSAPRANAEIGRYYTLHKYAEERGLLFYDFNEKEVNEETGFCFSTDSYDAAHINLWGAKKITDYLGRRLTKYYEIAGKTDEQWENTRESYQYLQKDCELVHITEIDNYIEALRDDRYSVFISAKGTFASELKSSTIQRLREAGLKVELQTDDAQEDFYFYYAVLSDGQVKEYIGYDQKVYRSSIRNGLTTFQMNGEGSIMIEGEERSRGTPGLNIVVYHNDQNRVLDSVCFDTTTKENTVNR